MASSIKGLDIPLPVAISLGACIVVLIALILLWWILRRRKNHSKVKLMEHPRVLALSLTGSSSRPSSSAGSSSQMKQAEPPGLQEKYTAPPPKSERRTSKRLSSTFAKDQRTDASYLQMGNGTDPVMSRTKSSRTKKSSNFHGPPIIIPPTDRANLKVPDNPGTSVTLQRHPSVKSFDSASMYSTASAPLDFHDRVFQSWRLDPVPASPLSDSTAAPPSISQIQEEYVEPVREEPIKELPKRSPKRPASSPQTHHTKQVSEIREALAPETYDLQRKTTLDVHPYRRMSGTEYQVPRHVNRSLDDINTRILPSTPLTAPPAAVYFPPPRSAAHYVPTAPSAYVPPRTPPKSPLRRERHSYLDIS